METDLDKKSYSYDEAIELAGNGWYDMGLAATLSISLLAMCLDLFSFSVVVSQCSCDFQLALTQKSILVSMPFVGPVIMAYAWGYISDTRGRRFSLLIGLSVSFLMSVMCAFAPNWIALAVFKFIGTCFCSCAQSATYTLMGESCSYRKKGSYILIMTGITHIDMPFYFALSYIIGRLNFSYNLGFINFAPWRLLVLIFALPLGVSAICMLFFYESPKYLLATGRDSEALEVLRKISKRNGKTVEQYPVQKLVLNEEGNVRRKNVPLMQSLMEQTLPLFKTPYLKWTLMLYYLIFVVYGSSGSMLIWMPFIADAFFNEDNSSISECSFGLCNMISLNSNLSSESETMCNVVSLSIVITFLVGGAVFCTLNLLMSKVSSRKKSLMIIILVFGGTSCVLSALVPNLLAGLFYICSLVTMLCIGPLFSYYVELFPTCFRGMASCLGVMVSRISSIIAINLVGQYITEYCTTTLYTIGAAAFSGMLVSCFLPPDRPVKKVH